MVSVVQTGFSAFILAGGKSTRMGADKAFIEYEGCTLLERVLALTRSVTSEVCIVGDQAKFGAFAPVLEDTFRDCGPLAGIHAALRSSRTELNLMLAVDMPFVSPALLQYLVAQAQAAPDAVVVVPQSEERRQPLCAVYRRNFADAAEKSLRSGENRIDRLFDFVPTRVITAKELEAAGFAPGIFHNLNTPEELEAAMKKT
jgi:molybdenum cofactor guanylyltransferase